MRKVRCAVAGALIALTALTAATDGETQAEPIKNNETAATTIPLRRGRNRVYAKTVVNGTEVGYLTIDTGSTFTVLHADVARQRNLRRIGRRWVDTQLGRSLFDVAVAASLKVGPLELKDQLI